MLRMVYASPAIVEGEPHPFPLTKHILAVPLARVAADVKLW